MGRLGALRVFGRLYFCLLWIMTYTLQGQIIIYQRFSSRPTQFVVKWDSDMFSSSFKMIENDGGLRIAWQYLDDIHLYRWSWHVVVILYNRLIMTMVTSWCRSYRGKRYQLVNLVQPSAYCLFSIRGTAIDPSVREKLRKVTSEGLIR